MEKEEIKLLRKQLNLSQIKFAEYLGVTERTLRNYETGTVEVPTPVINLMNFIQLNAPNLNQSPKTELQKRIKNVESKDKITEIIQVLRDLYDQDLISRDGFYEIEKILLIEKTMR